MLERLLRLVHEGTPIVTLIGAPGIGKSHVLSEACARLLSEREFIEVAPGGAPSRFANAAPLLAELRPAHVIATADRLIAFVDDVGEGEGVAIDAVRRIREGLVTPGITFVMAARRPSRARGEYIIELPPLETEPTDGAPSAAAEVFIAHAVRVIGAWEPTREEVARVERVARSVDGLPLALCKGAELLRVMSLDRIVKEAETDALASLLGRVVPGWLSTVEAAAASLNDESRLALAASTVFGGPFGFEDLAAVIEWVEPSLSLEEALPPLRETGLLALSGSLPAARMRVLAPVRFACRAGIDEALAARIAEAHARHIGRIAIEAVRSAGPDIRAHKLVAYRPELVTAIAYMTAPTTGPRDDQWRASSLAVATLLGATAVESGNLDAARLELERWVGVVREEALAEDPRLLGEAELELGRVLQHQGLLTEAIAKFSSALEHLGDGPRRSDALERLGRALLQSGDVDAARTALAEAAEVASAHGRTAIEAKARGVLGLIEASHGEISGGLKVLEGARDAAAKLGSPLVEAQLIADIAWCQLQLGEFEPAAERFEQAMRLFADASADGELVLTARLAAVAVLGTGQTSRALDIASSVSRDAERLGRHLDVAWAEIIRALALIRLEKSAGADGALDAALLAEGDQTPLTISSVVHVLRAIVESDRGDAGAAARQRDEARSAARALPSELRGWRLALVRLAEAHADAALAIRAQKRGDAAGAGEHLMNARRRSESVFANRKGIAARQSAFLKVVAAVVDDRIQQAESIRVPRRVLVGSGGEYVYVEGRGKHDLSRRGPAKRLLVALVERSRGAGAPLDVEALFAIGWPGATIRAAAAAARVYVVINQLRESGLREVLVRDDRGYYLSRNFEVVFDTTGEARD